MTDKGNIKISWDKITKDSQTLAQAIIDQGLLDECKGILAVSRGGMAVAQLVAYYLDIRRVETVSVMGYEEETKIPQHMLGEPSRDLGDGKGWIVIDDLVDSGRSYQFLKGHFPKATYTALYSKPVGKKDAHIVVGDFKATDPWLDFPWEMKPLR